MGNAPRLPSFAFAAQSVAAVSVAALTVAALFVAEPARAQTLKNPRVACGCPTARLLARGAQVLDGGQTVSAWLHDGADVMPFRRNADKPQLLDPIEAPLRFDELPVDGAVPSTSRFVRATATGPLAEGTFVGVLRRNDPSPRDVVAVTSAGAAAAGTSPRTAAPDVAALWLGPLAQRERPGCGAWLTHMIAFEARPGSPPVEAFLVKDTDSGKTALVDARAAGVFGIGRVEVCEQGLPLTTDPVLLEIRPVSSTFGIGEAWAFKSDGTGTTDVARAAFPAAADRERIEDPFPIPGEDQGGGATQKELALFVMGTVVGGAALFALFFFVVIPLRKRRMVDITCPACQSKVPFDALDPKTDGFFCPSCGKAGFWKGKDGDAVDATRL